MQLDLLGFTEATRRFAAAAQAATKQALDFTKGSVLRAIGEANAALGLWVQWQVLRVRSLTRLATSVGTDVDSWVADFGLARLPGVAATGNVTLSRYAPTQGALVVPGTLVRTSDGTATFAIGTDTANSLWSTTAGASPGYFMPPNTASVTVPAVSVTSGQAGNVGTGTISLLASAVPGVDTVTNAAPFAGGLDAESDSALRVRFVAYIASLSEATEAALLYAGGSVQQGLALQVVEGSIGSGQATLYVDDGTGSPSLDLLTRVGAAVEFVRPIGMRVQIQRPMLVPVSIAVTLAYPVGTNVQAAEASIDAAVAAYVATLGMGQALSYARLAQIVLDAAPIGSDVVSLMLNSGAATITASAGRRVHLTSLTVV